MDYYGHENVDLIRLDRLEQETLRMRRDAAHLVEEAVGQMVDGELDVLAREGLIFDHVCEREALLHMERPDHRANYYGHMRRFYRRREGQVVRFSRSSDLAGVGSRDVDDIIEETARRMHEGGEKDVTVEKVRRERMARA